MIKEWFKKNIWHILFIILIVTMIVLTLYIGTMLGVISWTPTNITKEVLKI